ncbi:hypothetical protein PHYPSEUDO_003392 [Phytophthora pseudosyringae]|uniref:Uncharacterized protein n=1 Tax=Phytophthora pseudosyringae TaxID=221518 RepID=A0A8T1VUN3_9STRA|nr:hypothetical protein PHYPSEUDO_003392 [Phytophthora pseudosyringae]
MADSDNDSTRTLLQYLIFVVLLVIGLSPFLLMLWKNAAYRERLRDTFCCKDCSDLCTRRVHYDEADLRTLRELEQPPQRESVGINGAYRTYQARRSRLSLRLASWREDVKRGGGDDDRLHHKLSQIQAAQYRRQQTQSVTTSTSTSSTPANRTNRANRVPNIPFDIRVVEINDRVDESNSSSAAASSNTSDLLNDSDEESVYELVPPTPKNEQRDAARIGRRSAATAEEEEEEKEDVAPRDHEIV